MTTSKPCGLSAYLAPSLYLNDISQAAWATNRHFADYQPIFRPITADFGLLIDKMPFYSRRQKGVLRDIYAEANGST
jgi:hypothetical protein